MGPFGQGPPSPLPLSPSQSHFWCDEWNQSASAPRRSTQIHCWPPAGFYCSCPSSPCRRRAKKWGEREERDSLHRRKKECKRASLKKCKPSISLPRGLLIDIFTSFKLCECSIYSRPPPILGIGGGRSRMRAVGGEVRGGENAQELDDTLITSAEE